MSETIQCEIDERIQDENSAIEVCAERFADRAESLAREVIDCPETLCLGLYPFLTRKDFADLLSLLAYACEIPSRQRRTPMDVQKMVKVWMPLVKKLATAHDIDERDQASSALDELLKPIIAAPVAQIRQFYRELTKQLKADPSVPWAVWRLFDFWGENVLDKIEKEEIEGLKKELALRIVERSIKQIPTEDWINAMVGALEWRTPAKLKEIEERLESGEKPRIRGKQSCLFLEVGQAEVML